ncbi:hypothetical protein HDU96_002071 [Phlyctochytrium bullatum]|nr:hypothetical protein HDU96_002071 [Phlyctochytrium bullatum]
MLAITLILGLLAATHSATAAVPVPPVANLRRLQALLEAQAETRSHLPHVASTSSHRPASPLLFQDAAQDNVIAAGEKGTLNERLPITSPPWKFSKNKPPAPVPLDGVDSQGRFRDVLGRQRLFRGTNVVMKGEPWYPWVDRWDKQYSFNIDDISFMGDLNMNAVRLGVMWPGVEPVRGQYNQTYLDIMKDIVRMCNDKGIYVLLEFHQDSLSERFCGEGVPLWAVDISSPLDRAGIHLPNSSIGFPRPAAPAYNLPPSGIPTPEDCAKLSWSTYQLTYAAANAYQNIYDNINGLLDAFAAYWRKVAEEFKDFPNVLGYDIINEPFAGQVFEIPSLFIPGVADRTNIQKLNKAVGDAIREVDKKNLIMFEGVTWDNFITGFTDVPGGYGYRNQSAISFHYYKFKQGGPNVGTLKQCFKDHRRDAKRLGSGLIMTEFYVPWEEWYAALDLADAEGISWLTWEYKPFINITGVGNSFFDQVTGELMENSIEIYTRSFVHAVQGSLVPNSMLFSVTTSDFKFSYWADPEVRGPTEARIQTTVYYPNGYNVTIMPPEKATWRVHPESEYLLLFELTDKAAAGDEISVFIQRTDAPGTKPKNWSRQP